MCTFERARIENGDNPIPLSMAGAEWLRNRGFIVKSDIQGSTLYLIHPAFDLEAVLDAWRNIPWPYNSDEDVRWFDECKRCAKDAWGLSDQEIEALIDPEQFRGMCISDGMTPAQAVNDVMWERHEQQETSPS